MSVNEIAQYCLARCALLPNRKIAIMSSTNRQSRSILRKIMDTIDSSDSIQYYNDRVKIGDSYIYCLELGNGDRCRGLRATDLIFYNHECMERESIENVIAGFGAISQSPIEDIKKRAAGQDVIRPYHNNQVILC